MTITTPVFGPRSTYAIGTRTFRDQLEADLATGVRGGNKHRLIARIWWHLHGHNDLAGYATFRAQQERRTFAQLHADFDHCLPPQWAWSKPEAAPAPAAPAAAPKATTPKLERLIRTFNTTSDLADAQRDWVLAQGGVEALATARVINPANGRTWGLLQSSWFATSQTIWHLMRGRLLLLR